ncbi:MAG: response regulator [Anaerolineales bacterium]|nr:response regulator [Anaerolineales bacterium]
MASDSSSKILIVDDDVELCHLLCSFWKIEGYNPSYVRNGTAALKHLANEKEQETPIDLVLLDIMMPGIDGIETCRRIRTDLNLPDLPIIMLTARSSIKDRLNALEAGANDYLTKPFELKELKARSLTWLKLRQENRYRAIAEAKLRSQHEDLQLAYQAVDRSRQEWKATFSAITDGISVLDENITIVRVNPTLEKILDLDSDQLIGQSGNNIFKEWYNNQNPSPLDNAIRDNQLQTFIINQPGGRPYHYRVTIYPLDPENKQRLGAVQVIQDITKETQSQAQLIQSEKMAALGRMAASLAHEINNPLQAIKSGFRLLSKPTLSEDKRKQFLDVASSEVDRLLTIVDRMLDFHRSAPEIPKPTDINSLIDQVLTLAQKTLHYNQVSVSTDLAQDIPPCFLIAGQFKQVFLNMVLNAVQAMPNGGSFHIETRRVNSNVHIIFADTGEGIEPEKLDKVFDPSFTTKEKGTGLGLAVSYGIVEQHGGHIQVTSKVGEGSVFKVIVPIGEIHNNGEPIKFE